jgi:F-type H+-transporting ATPase subunit b
MKKILLPIAALFLFVGVSDAKKSIPNNAPDNAPEGAHQVEPHEAHHFCEHVAPEYHINWIDLFGYKHHNHEEVEKCIKSVEEFGSLVLPGQVANDGNLVKKPEVDAGLIEKGNAKYNAKIYRPKISGPPYLAALFNFLVLIWILVRFAKKPLQDFLHNRYDTIKNALEESTKRFDEAQARLAEYEQRLKNMENEKSALMRQYEEQAQQEVTKLKEDAARHLAKIQIDSKRELENALLTAEKSIRREAVEAAISMAESILTKELNQDDRQRLTDQFISRVNTQKNLRGNA